MRDSGVDDRFLHAIVVRLAVEAAQIRCVFRRRAIVAEAVDRFEAEVDRRILAIDQRAHARPRLGIVARRERADDRALNVLVCLGAEQILEHVRRRHRPGASAAS